MKFLAILGCLLTTVILSEKSPAAEPSAEDRKASLAIVLGSDKPLTRVEYDLFWSRLASFTSEERRQFIVATRSEQSDLMDFNLYTWKCADEAWLNKQSVECPKALEVWDRLSKRLIKGYGVTLDKTAPIFENHRRIISASSQRHTYRSVTGEIYDLSERKVILDTISSLSRRAERLSKALSEKFTE